MSSKLASQTYTYIRVNRRAAILHRRKGEEDKAFERLRLIEQWEVLAEWLFQAAERLKEEPLMSQQVKQRFEGPEKPLSKVLTTTCHSFENG